MGLLERIFSNYDKYRDEANMLMDEAEEWGLEKYAHVDDDTRHRKVGERLQYFIDARNNQGGHHAHKYALAYWQIFNALYPEYISAEPPTFVEELWKKSQTSYPEENRN